MTPEQLASTDFNRISIDKCALDFIQDGLAYGYLTITIRHPIQFQPTWRPIKPTTITCGWICNMESQRLIGPQDISAENLWLEHPDGGNIVEGFHYRRDAVPPLLLWALDRLLNLRYVKWMDAARAAINAHREDDVTLH